MRESQQVSERELATSEQSSEERWGGGVVEQGGEGGGGLFCEMPLLSEVLSNI